MDSEAVPPSNRLAQLKKNSMRDRVVAAYQAYSRNEPFSMDNLLKVVREFAYTKVYHLEYDFKDFGSFETADDWAQEATINVWLALKDGKFEGNGEQFYSWIHKIAFNRATDAFNELENARAKKVSLTVASHEGGDPDAEEYEDDNPDIYSSRPADGFWVGDGVDENGNVKYKRGNSFDGVFTIPKSVQGVDLSICRLILAGKNYAQIADILEMTETAVTKRLQKLRKRLRPEGERERGRQREGPLDVAAQRV